MKLMKINNMMKITKIMTLVNMIKQRICKHDENYDNGGQYEHDRYFEPAEEEHDGNGK